MVFYGISNDIFWNKNRNINLFLSDIDESEIFFVYYRYVVFSRIKFQC